MGDAAIHKLGTGYLFPEIKNFINRFTIGTSNNPIAVGLACCFATVIMWHDLAKGDRTQFLHLVQTPTGVCHVTGEA